MVGILDEVVESMRLRRRLRAYVQARPVYWCSPYCAESFGTAERRSVHRAVCALFERYSMESIGTRRESLGQRHRAGVGGWSVPGKGF